MVNDLDLEQNVTFVGFLQPEKYLETLNSVDALNLPSRIEAFAITVIEAMALGKPVITSNTGGIPEIIKEGRNGILVEPEPDQIARAIIYLYENEGLRKKISQNNREDVINYDWKPIVKQYMAVYRELIEEAQTK
jgi:glycosyltransferase involved in cell wall biosynthesis